MKGNTQSINGKPATLPYICIVSTSQGIMVFLIVVTSLWISTCHPPLYLHSQYLPRDNGFVNRCNITLDFYCLKHFLNIYIQYLKLSTIYKHMYLKSTN